MIEIKDRNLINRIWKHWHSTRHVLGKYVKDVDAIDTMWPLFMFSDFDDWLKTQNLKLMYGKSQEYHYIAGDDPKDFTKLLLLI